MKKHLYIWATASAMLLTGCGDWLSIDPEDQVSEKTLYSNADGFHNQMNGIYRTLAEGSLYGRELTWGYVDALAQYYNYYNSSSAANAYRHGASDYDYEYALSKSITKSIWEQGYNAIANCNDLLVHLPAADTTWFYYKKREVQLMEGEALALRAMIHFDLLRLYAPAPVKNDSKAYIPYVKEFPTYFPAKLPTKQVIDNILADLARGEELTAQFDSLYSGVMSLSNRMELQGSGLNRFTDNRGYRLNHFAIKALTARVALYAGRNDLALKKALELIALNTKYKWFSYTSKYAMQNNGKTKLYDNVIFALYNNNLNLLVNALNVDDEIFLGLEDYSGIFGPDAESSKQRNPDYRALLFKNEGLAPSLKLTPSTGTKADVNNRMIPLIRMSEVYYIAAECLFATDKTKAVNYLQGVRTGRGVVSGLADASTLTEFQNLIINDMRRELFGEGQLFFGYKRLNFKVIQDSENSLTLTDKEFVLPIPESNDVL